MKKMATIFCSLSIVCTLSIAEAASKYAIVVSSGQQSSTAGDALVKASQFLNSSGYSQSLVLSDKPAENIKVTGPATSKGLLDAFKQLGDQVQAGDQVLIYMMVHGSPTVADGDKHSLWLSDGPLSYLKFQDYLKDLDGKSALVAFVDASCFSGSSLDLASENVCVVTAARPNEEAFATFDADFWNAASAGLDLESIFLKARGNHLYCASPMISTQEGALASKALSNTGDFFTQGNFQNFRQFLGDSPTGQSNMTLPISSLIANISDQIPQYGLNGNVQGLNNSFISYSQSASQSQSPSLGGIDMSQFMKEITVAGENVSLLNLAMSDYEQIILTARTELTTVGVSLETKSAAQDRIQKANSFLQKRLELIQSDRNFSAVFYNFNNNFKSFLNIMNIQAKVPVVRAERLVFTDLYKTLVRTQHKDACKRFIF